MSIEISTNIVSWYGAILATISFVCTFILALLNYLRDKAKIKVEKSEGWVNYGMDTSNDQIIIKAINTGRRTVTLNNVGFFLKGGGSVILPNSETIKFPYELGEGKSVIVFTDKSELLKDLKKKKKEINYAWYSDATGKIYKTRCKIKSK